MLYDVPERYHVEGGRGERRLAQGATGYGEAPRAGVGAGPARWLYAHSVPAAGAGHFEEDADMAAHIQQPAAGRVALQLVERASERMDAADPLVEVYRVSNLDVGSLHRSRGQPRIEVDQAAATTAHHGPVAAVERAGAGKHRLGIKGAARQVDRAWIEQLLVLGPTEIAGYAFQVRRKGRVGSRQIRHG